MKTQTQMQLRGVTASIASRMAFQRSVTVVAAGTAGFADALIAAVGARAGCVTTVTFDRRASRLPGFTLL
ncbi:MAG TPA: hypothetical protein VIR38_11170 [Thalassobaculum sp.]